MTLNLATLYEAVAAAVPDRLALACGDRRLSYAALDERANAVAHHLIETGIRPGEHVGIYMLNDVEYVEGMLAILKARAVPVNINYRYTQNELLYLFNDAQLSGVLVGEEFLANVAELAEQCSHLKHVLVAPDPDAETESGVDHQWPGQVSVAAYDQALSGRPTDPPLVDERSDDDTFVLYTGGTTGMPKGVVWRHEDFFFAALSGANPYGDPHRSAEELATAASNGMQLTYLLTMPLMHGAASYTLLTALFGGSSVVLMRRYEATRALQLIQDEKINILAVVGDAMARPFVDTLRQHQESYDLSSLFVVGSGGAILSQSIENELTELLPNLFIRNSFGASESGSDGQIVLGSDGLMRLQPSPSVMVVDERHQPLEADSPDIGWLARSGHVPLSYFNDPEKTAQVFPVINGVRWAILGDAAQVEADGTIVVLGRGSGSINTGGEKVYPEEVEQAIKAHPDVMDTLVAGVPDDRFGERVAAVVETRPGHEVDPEDLKTHCRELIAGYKLPAVITFVERIQRSPAGKADYRWAKDVLTEAATS